MVIKLFKTYDLPEPEGSYTNDAAVAALANGSIIQPIVVDNEAIRSGAFKTGVSGWCFFPDGTIEANNGYFRGDVTGATGTFTGTITATTGAIGGFNIGADYVRDV